MTRLINIDNGGTFTDVCVVDAGEIHYAKTLTTPFDLGQCFLTGLGKAAELVCGTADPEALLHGTEHLKYATTRAPDALRHRQGPKLGLLSAQRAFPELLATEPVQRDMFNALVGDRVAWIAPDAEPDALEAALDVALSGLMAAGAARLVVSIGGPDGASHESRILELLCRGERGGHPLAVSPVLSWKTADDVDEVRRTWTSLLNAFVQPATDLLLRDTERRLGEIRADHPLLIFRNDGRSSRSANLPALKTFGSGPRGGLEGTRALATAYDFEQVVMVDIGGTTTDIGVVTGQEFQVWRGARLSGVPTSLELAAISSHGIGGGSALRVRDGAITVGPDSVGAVPGPACIGGGTEATISDVLLLRGILNGETFLNGEIELDIERSWKVVTANIADPLGLPLPEALVLAEDAYVHRIAELVSTTDISGEGVLVAVGGAGPMTACAAARKAGIRRVIVPSTAAVFSAVGIGLADPEERYEYPPWIGANGDGYASTAVRAGYRAVCGRDGQPAELPVFTLLEQQAGAYAAGPAVIEGRYFTMQVPEDWEFQTTVAGDLLLTDRSKPVPQAYRGDQV